LGAFHSVIDQILTDDLDAPPKQKVRRICSENR
jgi:hypothetical protein